MYLFIINKLKELFPDGEMNVSYIFFFKCGRHRKDNNALCVGNFKMRVNIQIIFYIYIHRVFFLNISTRIYRYMNKFAEFIFFGFI